MAIQATTVPSLVVGVVFLAMGVWVAALGSRRRLHWAFARVMAVWATANIALVFIAAPWDAADRLWFGAYLVLPFATVDLGLAFRWALRPPPSRRALLARRLTRTALALVATALVAALQAAPEATRDAAVTLALPFAPFALSAVGLGLAEGARAIPPSQERGSRVLFTSGFLLFPTFQGAFRMNEVLRGSQDGALDWVALALALAGLALAAAAAFRLATRIPHAASSRVRQAAPAVACALAGVAGLLPHALEFVPGPDWASIVFRALGGLCMLAFAGTVAYAMLRFSLFSLDPRFGRIVRDSGLAAVAAAVFFVVEQVAEQAFQGPLQRLGWFGAMVPFLAAAVAAALLLPARHLADGMLDQMGGGDASARKERRAGIYRAAVLAALQDARVTPRERQALRRLVGSLGLSAKEADAIEQDVSAHPRGRRRRAVPA